jgi:hypothetical protein
LPKNMFMCSPSFEYCQHSRVNTYLQEDISPNIGKKRQAFGCRPVW